LLLSCFPIDDEQLLLLYTSNRPIEPLDQFAGISLTLFSECEKQFPQTKLFLCYFVYLPPIGGQQGTKATFTYYAMLAKAGMGDFRMIAQHQLYCGDEAATLEAVRGAWSKKPIRFVLFDRWSKSTTFRTSLPSGAVTSVYGQQPSA